MFVLARTPHVRTIHTPIIPFIHIHTDVFGIRNETHALEHYLSKGRAEGRIFSAPAKAEGFEWMDYLEINPDIDPRKVFLSECVLNPLSLHYNVY
jgi:hypothetical protein